MSRNTYHVARSIGVGCVLAWLLPTAYILLPVSTHAAIWHCTACQCNCNTGLTGIGTIGAPYTRDSADPEGVCVASCRSACGTGMVDVPISPLPPSDPTAHTSIISGVPEGNFEGSAVSCTDLSATVAPTPGTPDEAAADAPTPHTPTEFGYRNPLGTTNLNTVINRVIKAALGFVGALFLAMFIYAGVLYMTGGTSVTMGTGDQAKQINKAKQTMINAIMGMLVIALAYTIISLIFQTATQVRG